MTTFVPAHLETPVPVPRLYATFYRRFQGLVVDSTVYAGSLVTLVILIELTGGSRAIGLSWLGFFLLYEPVLVARRGATWGHAYANIRVVDLRTGRNPGFLRAIGRFLIKGLFGLFAFVFMATTRRHQALHDLVFRTTVEIRDPTRASRYDYVPERLPERARIAAPVWRRVVVIVCYSVACFLLYGFALLATESRECFEENLCSVGERILEVVATLLWVGAQAITLAFGWRGRLLGARSGRVMGATASGPGAS